MDSRFVIEIDLQIKEDKFPSMTFFLLILIYVIGIILIDTSRFQGPDSYRMDTLIITIPETADLLTLIPDIRWQWQIFSYFLIHFAIVHYGYSGLLMLYYLQGLERATNKTTVLLSFILTSVLSPIILGPMIFLIWSNFSFASDFFFIQDYYMGSSVGIWGAMGLSAAVSRKRRFFWVIIILLLLPEFFLKLTAGTGDLTANVFHIAVFLINWSIAKRIFVFKNNDHQSGGLKLDNKRDLGIIILFMLHAIILIIHFLDSLSIFDQNILYYVFNN